MRYSNILACAKMGSLVELVIMALSECFRFTTDKTSMATENSECSVQLKSLTSSPGLDVCYGKPIVQEPVIVI